MTYLCRVWDFLNCMRHVIIVLKTYLCFVQKDISRYQMADVAGFRQGRPATKENNSNGVCLYDKTHL
jgi:hypothetical protein